MLMLKFFYSVQPRLGFIYRLRSHCKERWTSSVCISLWAKEMNAGYRSLVAILAPLVVLVVQ